MEACFFGETVSVPSRIIDDEDEECENSIPTVKNYEIELDANPSKMILAVDKLSKAFCKVYLMLSNEAIGYVYETDEDNPEEREEKFAFYKTPEASTFVALSQGTDPLILNKFAKKFLSCWDAQIIVLKNDHISFHKSLEPLDVSVLTRVLKSSSCDIQLKIPRLEEPNFVSGIPAAILSYSELMNKQTLVLLSFTDTFEPDSISISGFLPLLKHVESVEEKIVGTRLKNLVFQIQTDQIYM